MSFVIPPSPEERLNRRQQFRLVEKLRIAERAIKIGWVNPVAWEEGVSPTNVRRWIEQRQELQQKVDHYKARKTVNRFRVNAKYNLKSSEGLRDHDIEESLLAFWKERNENNLPCSVWDLVRKWGQMEPELVNVLSNNACRMRMYRFMRRNNLSRRKVTHQAQANDSIQDNVDDFVQYVQMRMKMLGVSACNVWNADETNIFFAPDTKWTIAERGSRSVSCRKPKSSARASVMLGASMEGEKMPPYIIFKGKLSQRSTVFKEVHEPQKYGYPRRLAYYLQENAWMDEQSMLEWIRQVWNPIANRQEGIKLLLLDEATAHMTTLVRQAFTVTNTVVEFIPGGYTSKLQAMDVGINKPFKDHVRECVEDFLFNNDYSIRPRRQDVAEWVESAWDKIRTDTFLKTWKRIGYIKTNPTIDMDDMESTQEEGDCLAMQEPTEDDSSTDGGGSVDSDDY